MFPRNRANVYVGRAQAAPTIQKHFERPGPLDPRYQMIDHLAPKFSSHSLAHAAVHEPRAAFLLNRFSEKLPILYATHAAQLVLHCDPDEAVGLSFYEYIDEAYLLGAVNAIERAKENDSIAYMRLLWKTRIDPIRADEDDDILDEFDEDEDNDDDDDEDESQPAETHPPTQAHHQPSQPTISDRFEVECLLSASSDGLIVVIRRAPPIEGLGPNARPPGIFASPWATSPLPPYSMTPPPPSPVEPNPPIVREAPENTTLPGPSDQDVMNSIRDVSVFAWSIASLNDNVSNDNLSDIAHGEVYSEEENVGSHNRPR